MGIGPARWGLIPAWAKDAKIGYKAINARCETVTVKPMFRSAFRSRRCIIPADGFYEWQKPSKQPYYFSPIGEGDFFSFAGLWERWKNAEGESIVSCSIVTTTANAVVKPVHDRMPVALDCNAATFWLSASEDLVKLKDVLKPYYENHMTAWQVSKGVGSPAVDHDKLIERMNVVTSNDPQLPAPVGEGVGDRMH